ncbi:MAG: TraR/DksA C4-type zinc finger protein [Methylobacter sp.]|nr:TraR/DksA C4-type zinc finger protein [Methylobacter sp.]MDP2429044.1 TraR/DksA C4-type zinc finger protein [Methylobacter sp.]MDP3056545.1 TraR/DksA C4-type zinc finger protein [Methylobacter sp.]MDP3362034.1 TraR/DksA C4-type zinc finger protein [Methylobacter sp.]MDZ4221061.1 TraR/DksA C4-type zinc finger protein [Methylobacter sp.]
MSDDADLANDTAELLNDIALKRHQGRVMQHQVWKGGGVCCTDCDAVIPPERLAALPGCGRCVGCQTAVEQESRVWR